MTGEDVTRRIFGCSIVLMLVGLTTRAHGESSSINQTGREQGREFSTYVRTSDGIELAATVFTSELASAKARAPTVVEFTRYGRLTVEPPTTIDAWRQAGFNCVLVDARGSGASFGWRTAELSPQERQDIGSVIQWISRQAWSDGHVVATGLSYDADTAELATAVRTRALDGAVIRASEFDVYRDIAFPGGVFAKVGIDLWGQYTHSIDISENCLANSRDCAHDNWLAPVEGDKDLEHLRAALAAHQENSRADRDFGGVTFSDDYFPSGTRVDSIGASAVSDSIRVRAMPAQVWASWVDAGTAASALERFDAFPATATEVYIAAWNHGGGLPADPFFRDGGPTAMSPARQFGIQLNFMRLVVAGGSVERVIHYVPLNSTRWMETHTWPPRSVTFRREYLWESHQLQLTANSGNAKETENVDFGASTGSRNRWRGNFFGGPVVYKDRSKADNELLFYDTPPLQTSIELIGDVVANLAISVDRTDAAIYVYLEDVAPEGRVTYLTEGELRLLQRKGPACRRTFARSDALPVVPGKRMNVSVCLEPVAAHIRAHHRLRLAIAGADANTFTRYPATGSLAITLWLGGKRGSWLQLPELPWPRLSLPGERE